MTNNALAILANWILAAIGLKLTSFVVPGFKIDSFFSALIAALVVGFFNILLGPLLTFLTLPLTLLTLGLFLFVVNAIILKISAAFLKGFDIQSWTSAIIGSVVLTLINYGIRWVFL